MPVIFLDEEEEEKESPVATPTEPAGVTFLDEEDGVEFLDEPDPIGEWIGSTERAQTLGKSYQDNISRYQELMGRDRTPEETQEAVSFWQAANEAKIASLQEQERSQSLLPVVEKINAQRRQARIDQIEGVRLDPVFGDEVADQIYQLDEQLTEEILQAREIADPAEREEAISSIAKKYGERETGLLRDALEASNKRFDAANEIAWLLQQQETMERTQNLKLLQDIGNSLNFFAGTESTPSRLLKPFSAFKDRKTAIQEGRAAIQDAIMEIYSTVPRERLEEVRLESEALRAVRRGEQEVAIVQGRPVFSRDVQEDPERQKEILDDLLAEGDINPVQHKSALEAIDATEEQIRNNKMEFFRNLPDYEQRMEGKTEDEALDQYEKERGGAISIAQDYFRAVKEGASQLIPMAIDGQSIADAMASDDPTEGRRLAFEIIQNAMDEMAGADPFIGKGPQIAGGVLGQVGAQIAVQGIAASAFRGLFSLVGLLAPHPVVRAAGKAGAPLFGFAANAGVMANIYGFDYFQGAVQSFLETANVESIDDLTEEQKAQLYKEATDAFNFARVASVIELVEPTMFLNMPPFMKKKTIGRVMDGALQVGVEVGQEVFAENLRESYFRNFISAHQAGSAMDGDEIGYMALGLIPLGGARFVKTTVDARRDTRREQALKAVQEYDAARSAQLKAEQDLIEAAEAAALNAEGVSPESADALKQQAEAAKNNLDATIDQTVSGLVEEPVTPTPEAPPVAPVAPVEPVVPAEGAVEPTQYKATLMTVSGVPATIEVTQNKNGKWTYSAQNLPDVTSDTQTTSSETSNIEYNSPEEAYSAAKERFKNNIQIRLDSAKAQVRALTERGAEGDAERIPQAQRSADLNAQLLERLDQPDAEPLAPIVTPAPEAAPVTPTPTEPAPIVPAVTQEQKAVAETVSPAAVLPEQEPADMPDTRGQNRQFHGAREPIPELTEGYYNAANIYGGESTFYTTDAVDIAAGYQRRKPNSVVYEVTEKAPVNFFNMEERRPAEDWIRDFNPKTEGVPSIEFFDFAAELAAEKANGTPNLREVMDEMRAEAANEGYSRDTVQEFFAMITENLEKQGYGGMTHIGGLQTNRPQHNVKIYFKPAEQLNLQPVDVRGNPITPEGAPTPTAEPPTLAPLRRVAKAEQTEDDVSGLVDAGLVELYKGQPVITEAGLEALPESERPRLTPEARKIQIDTGASAPVAEAISKGLRFGVDQVPPTFVAPEGWTLEGDVYVPTTQKIPTTIEELYQEFDAKGAGHAQFRGRLESMVSEGALTNDARDMILATLWESNVNDEFLLNIEAGSMSPRAMRSLGRGGFARQQVQGPSGPEIGFKPSLKLFRNTRQRYPDLDLRDAQVLATFWHEFGHVGYYSLLNDQQKAVVDAEYNKTTKEQRRRFFEEGVAAAQETEWFRKYYAKNQSEWFAQSFGEYVLTQKSDNKKLLPVFEKILDKIKSVFNKLFNRQETVKLEDIFEFILRGEAYGTQPVWYRDNLGRQFTMSRAPSVYTSGPQIIRGVGRAAPTEAPQISEMGIWQAPEQEITSQETSINEKKIPAVFNQIKEWVSGTINADIGGGRFDNVTNWLRDRGVENLIIDWFNRDRTFNETNIDRVRGGQADTATISNVLNVIQEPDARDLVIRQAADAIKEEGVAYFYIYEGSGSGRGRATTKGWQENRKTASYMEEISQHFGSVERRNQMIIARDPIKDVGVEAGQELPPDPDANEAATPQEVAQAVNARAEAKKAQELVTGHAILPDEIPPELNEEARANYNNGMALGDFLNPEFFNLNESYNPYIAALWLELNGGLMPTVKVEGKEIAKPEKGTTKAEALRLLKRASDILDARSETTGGKDLTYSLQDIMATWMESGLGEAALKNAIVQFTNLDVNQATKTAGDFARVYELAQNVADSKERARVRMDRALPAETNREKREKARMIKLEEAAGSIDSYAEAIKLAFDVDTKKPKTDRATERKQIEEMLRQAKQILRDVVPRQYLGDQLLTLERATGLEGLKKVVEAAQNGLNEARLDDATARARKAYDRAQKAVKNGELGPDAMAVLRDFVETYAKKGIGPETRAKIEEALSRYQQDPVTALQDLAQEKYRKQAGALDAIKIDKSLGLDALREITRMVNATLHADRVAKGEMLFNKQQTREEAIAGFLEELLGVKSMAKARKDGSMTVGLFNKVALYKGARVESILRALGLNKLSEFVYERLTLDAYNDELRVRHQLKKKIEDRVKEITGLEVGTKDYDTWSREVIELTGVDSQGRTRPIKIYRKEFLDLVASLRDESNLRRAVNSGGYVIDRLDLSEVDTVKITPDTYVDIMDKMTDQDRQMVDMMVDLYNNDLFQILENASNQAYGHGIKAVTGTYYPRTADRWTRYSETKKDMDYIAYYQRRVDDVGYLKERDEKAKSKLRAVDFLQRLDYHVTNDARIGAYLPIVRDIDMVLGDPRISRTIAQKLGTEGLDQIKEMVRQQTTPTAGLPQGVLSTLVGNMGIGVLGFKLHAAMQNPVGIPIALGHYGIDGLKYARKGLLSGLKQGLNPADRRAMHEILSQYSPYYNERYGLGGFMQEFTSGMSSSRADAKWRKNLESAAMSWLEGTDKFGAFVRFRIAKEVIKDRTNLQEGTEDFNRAVAREWALMMFRSENTAHGADRTGIFQFAGRNPAFKMFIMFQSAVSKIYSLFTEAMIQAQQGGAQNMKESAVKLTFVGAALGLSASISNAFYSMLYPRDDEDEETKGRAVAASYLAAPLSVVPVVGNTLNTYARQWITGENRRKPMQMDVLSGFVFGSLDAMDAGFKAIGQGWNDEIDEKTGNPRYWDSSYRAIKDGLSVGGILIGRPFAGIFQNVQLARQLSTRIQEVASGEPNTEEFQNRVAEFEKEQRSEPVRQEYAKLYFAVADNDQRKFNRALKDLQAKRPDLKRQDIINAIRRRQEFRVVGMVESGKIRRSELDSVGLTEEYFLEQRALRRSMEEAARVMWRESRDSK